MQPSGCRVANCVISTSCKANCPDHLIAILQYSHQACHVAEAQLPHSCKNVQKAEPPVIAALGLLPLLQSCAALSSKASSIETCCNSAALCWQDI